MITPSIHEENATIVFEWPDVKVEAHDTQRTRSGLRCALRVVAHDTVIGTGTIAIDDIRQRREFIQSLNNRDGRVPDWDAKLILIADTIGERLTRRETTGRDFAVTPLADFMAKDWTAGEEIVEGLVRTGETLILYGQVGHGKTLEAAEVAIAVAAGRCAFGILPARQGRVLVVEEDMHPGRLQGYLKMLLDAYELTEIPDLFIWERQFLRLDDEAAAANFTDKVLEVRPVLIILDAFIDLHSGDGFAGRELRPVLDCIVALPQLLPCAVIIIDHPRKEATGSKQQADPIDALYGGRLKSALADTMILTKRTSDSPSRFTLSIVKTRSEPRAPFTVTFSAEEGFYVDETPIGLTPSANAIIQWARTLPAGSIFTKQHIQAATRLAKRTVIAAVHELTFNVMVQDAGQVGRAKAYRLTTSGEGSETEDQQPQRPLLSDLVPGGAHQDSGGVD